MARKAQVIQAKENRPVIEEADFLPLKAIDHLHFWVGNAKQAMFYWWKGLGFTPVAFSGLETGNRRFASYVLESGQIRIVVSSPYSPTDEMTAHHMLHGDGVKVVALEVEDVALAYAEVLARGARIVWTPKEEIDEFGELRTAAMGAYGDVLHVFVDRSAYGGPFAPTYQKFERQAESAGLETIESIEGAVPVGRVHQWVNFYHRVLGFKQAEQSDILNIYRDVSVSMSKSVQNGSQKLKFSLVEPAGGQNLDPVEAYLGYYFTPGVHHIALATNDILKTVSDLRGRGVEFFQGTDAYYDVLSRRVNNIREPLDEIREAGVLVEKDEDGYMLRIRSRPLQERPTVYFELVERYDQSKENYAALFEALDEE